MLTAESSTVTRMSWVLWWIFICWWKMCVPQQDGPVQQAGTVAAAGWELWSQYSPAGPTAGLEAAAALPDLQTLLQTGWAALTAHQQIGAFTGSTIFHIIHSWKQIWIMSALTYWDDVPLFQHHSNLSLYYVAFATLSHKVTDFPYHTLTPF